MFLWNRNDCQLFAFIPARDSIFKKALEGGFMKKRGPGRPANSTPAKKGKPGRPKGYSPKVASLGFNDKALRGIVEDVIKNYFENAKLNVEIKFSHTQRGRPRASALG